MRPDGSLRVGAWEDAALSDGSPAGIVVGRVRGRIHAHLLSFLSAFGGSVKLLPHYDASVGGDRFCEPRIYSSLQTLKGQLL